MDFSVISLVSDVIIGKTKFDEN